MKKLLSLFVCIPLLLCSCDKENDGNKKTYSEIGTWKVTSLDFKTEGADEQTHGMLKIEIEATIINMLYEDKYIAFKNGGIVTTNMKGTYSLSNNTLHMYVAGNTDDAWIFKVKTLEESNMVLIGDVLERILDDAPTLEGTLTKAEITISAKKVEKEINIDE
mgnify:CR=1 FL=1